MPTLNEDFRTLAALDPSLLTLRHWTGAEARALAEQAGMLYAYRVRRVFHHKVWNTPEYLTASLDESFEPKAEDRIRAAATLEKIRLKKFHRLQQRQQRQAGIAKRKAAREKHEQRMLAKQKSKQKHPKPQHPTFPRPSASVTIGRYTF